MHELCLAQWNESISGSKLVMVNYSLEPRSAHPDETDQYAKMYNKKLYRKRQDSRNRLIHLPRWSQ